MTESTNENQIEVQNRGTKVAKIKFRIGSFLIDILIYFIIGIILGTFHLQPIEGEFAFKFEFHFNGFSTIGMLLFGFFLWPISEGLWGQTIGKRFLNLKVVTHEYEQIELGQAVGRFLLGLIDCISLIGLMIAHNNKQNKRVGDFVAKTIVIRTKKPTQNNV